MNESYLWDRSGPPDREVLRLERVLGVLAAQPASSWRGSLVAPARRRSSWPLALGLALACAAAVALLLVRAPRPDRPAPAASGVVARPLAGGMSGYGGAGGYGGG